MKNYTKKYLKVSNGITLIALVITIIVLLILAGISISMLSGDNSILQRATDAKINTEKASIIEQARTDILAQIAENKGENISKEQLKSILNTYFDENEVNLLNLPSDTSTSAEELTSKEGNYKIKLSEIYSGYFDEKVVKSSVANLNDGDEVVYIDKDGNEIQCIVLYDSSNTYGVQIMTLNTISNVTLGMNDTSQNAEGTKGSATRARWSFNNAIDTLNAYAEAYRLENLSDIASAARCVGSIPNNPSSRNTENFYTDDYMYRINSRWDDNYKDKYESDDSNYTEDITKMNTLGIAKSNNNNPYWLASREISWGDDGQYETWVNFNVRSIDSTGSLSKSVLVKVGDAYGEVGRENRSYGVRPVFTLDSSSHYIEENGRKKLVE